MSRDSHAEAVQRLFDRQPTIEERRRLERMLRNLSPEVRDDPGLLEVLVVLNDFNIEFEKRLKPAVAAAKEEARAQCAAVLAEAARGLVKAHPELKAARSQALMMISGFAIVATMLIFLALLGLLKTGHLPYPHLSAAEQEQLQLGRRIQASGYPDAAVWAAETVRDGPDLNEVARFTEKLNKGENALDELAELRQCRGAGEQVTPSQGRWVCWFPLNSQ